MPAYISTSSALEFVGIDPNDEEPRHSVLVTIAGNLREEYSSVPDPEPSDYAERAEAAEKLIFEWLNDTKGYLSGVGVSGVSLSYGDRQAIYELVKATMGTYTSKGRTRSRHTIRG